MLKAVILRFDRFSETLGSITGILILVMLASVVYDIIARYFFNSPSLWVVDFNEYLLVYMTFLPISWLMLKDRHIRVTMLVDRLSPCKRRYGNHHRFPRSVLFNPPGVADWVHVDGSDRKEVQLSDRDDVA